jgi:hypothetical protein
MENIQVNGYQYLGVISVKTGTTTLTGFTEITYGDRVERDPTTRNIITSYHTDEVRLSGPDASSMPSGEIMIVEVSFTAPDGCHHDDHLQGVTITSEAPDANGVTLACMPVYTLLHCAYITRDGLYLPTLEMAHAALAAKLLALRE